MMMKFDVLTWINYFIGAFACCVSIFFSGNVLLNNKKVLFNIKNFLLLILFSIFLIFNSLILDNVLKILGTLLVFLLVYKYIFKCNIHDNFIYSVIACLIFLLGEVTFILFISLIDLTFKTEIAGVIIKSFFGNFFISLISFGYIVLLQNIIKKYITKLKSNNKLYFVFVGLITILVILSSIYKLSSHSWEFDYSFILNMIIIICSLLLLIVLLKQYLNTKEITDKYILLEDYLKTSADLIEKYSSTIHKYKNNLITIKGYVNNERNKDIDKVNAYIDNLLDNYKVKKYSWFSKLNYFEIDTLRYLIYYKLSKAEDNDLKLVVTVSTELKNLKYKKLNVNEIGILSDIVAEYLDNAIYAANESDEKILVLDIFKQDNMIYLVISNTFKNDFDINLIAKSGYTTKGKGHGLGLYDIDKQLKKISYINVNYKKIDNYFVVEVKLDIIKKKKD